MKNLSLVAMFIVLSFETLIAQPVWVRQNLDPGGFLLSVHVIDPQNVVCVGVAGRITRTTDGGTTWIEDSISVNEHLFDVTFSNSQRGVAVGMHGTILQTVDGGASWSVVASGTQQELYEVEFATVDKGWIVGAGGTILATTDGGDSWMQQSSGTTDNLYGIAVIDLMNLFAVGGFTSAIALTSTDGGQTWVVRQTGFSGMFLDVDIRSSLEATAVGTNGLIAITTDGGISWVNFVQYSGTFYGIEWSSATEAVIVTAGGSVYTTDGGTTWGAAGPGGHDIHSLNDVQFIAGTDGVFKRIGEYGWVLRQSGTTLNINSVSTTAANYAMAVGDSGLILKTTDGGTSWQTLNSGVSAFLNGVWLFSDPQFAVAVGNGGTILTTSDGGATWSQRTGGVFSDLWAVNFSSDIVGTAVGVNGTILRTTNGGVNWFAQTSGTTAGLNSVSFDSESFGIVGVSTFLGDKLLVTTNGGTSWAVTGSSIVGLVFAVSTLNVDNWIVGTSYRVFRTTDAGVTWSSHEAVGSGGRDMAFPDMLNGWVVGGQTGGSVFRTRDNGLTWNMQTVPAVSVLRGVSMWDTSRGIAVGDNGRILRTTNGGSIVVGVTRREPDIPTEVSLGQNYPNPFNPSTTIQYQLPARDHVMLKIYNLLGQEVTTLVNDVEEPGYKSVQWNASSLASGVYFYRLQSGSFVDTRKMILLR